MSLALCQVALELFEVEAGDPRRNLTPQFIIASEVNAKGCQERAAEEGLQARPGNFIPHRSSMPDVLAKSRASSAANQRKCRSPPSQFPASPSGDADLKTIRQTPGEPIKCRHFRRHGSRAGVAEARAQNVYAPDG
jgi:hypothetical protein